MDDSTETLLYDSTAHRRLRRRRLGRRAYIRSVQFLPSLATLGNAVCGFAAIYVAAFAMNDAGNDPWAQFFARHSFVAACYLIILSMVFDALDGRLARFARHTTDFGGQLDSLADAVSFGAAPAFLALQVFKADGPTTVYMLSRLIWAAGALYFACALVRLARFNVSNEHGEQAHMSFLGLPSPGAAGAVVGVILMQQDLKLLAETHGWWLAWAGACFGVALIPVVLVATGLLMVANIRYPHVINRYLRGRKPIARLIGLLAVLLIMVADLHHAHRYVFGIGALSFALGGAISWMVTRSGRTQSATEGTLPAGGAAP
ncbi:MAG: CDP-diacylglycerol--serine O-phosphatidyltransferase [Phycisphaerales bacterium]|nr:CDP-diacylglycerol--serine O-phosphatidyltransferase [Phycisphaerales bacterium]